MFDALLFDLDGTLIDTESLAIAAGLAAFAEVGHPVSVEFLHGLVGIDLPGSRRIIGAALPGVDQERLHPIWRAGFDEAMERGLALKPGVTEMLAGGRVPMAVVTSSARAEAHYKLRLSGIAAAFDLVISRDDVTLAKPAPEPYLLAAQRLGVLPSRCLVFEDSEVGAEAAHRAGCVVVQVPDVVPGTGKWAHHLAENIIQGARMAGLVI